MAGSTPIRRQREGTFERSSDSGDNSDNSVSIRGGVRMTTSNTPVRASDRLQDVFERDERLVDVLAGHSPQLAKLRHSPMRRIMARVTTVEQAARLCGVSAASLVRDLNKALNIASSSDDSGGIQDDAPQANSKGSFKQVVPSAVPDRNTMPSLTATLTPTIELDVRDDLRNGREPFSRIMTTVAALGDVDVLHLRTTFEPVPLFAVMDRRGFAHHAEQHDPGDWSVWFYRSEASSTDQAASSGTHSDDESAPPAASAQAEPSDGALTTQEKRQEKRPEEIWLDVRGLEPPEPMVRTLEALEELPAKSVLIQINVRVPQFLLPILRERGFVFEIDESHVGQVQVRIWRVTPPSTR